MFLRWPKGKCLVIVFVREKEIYKEDNNSVSGICALLLKDITCAMLAAAMQVQSHGTRNIIYKISSKPWVPTVSVTLSINGVDAWCARCRR